ncbi:hypothetical protein BEN47_04740 [Hymenobacter lapidarius]|uniref:Uncharacterized protein n=1 Tax=Hymenobacter lapidarius TaxID=1908237 RepID=A0A1G1STH1_9BACT|nr:hypothetical protein [Hymenobacter lapidarius]OGX81934.1 hypothetical protein BEN47_04740 [Hymenobacter lapidarius]
MKPTEGRVQQLPQLVRLLMLLTAAVLLVLMVVLTQPYGPAPAAPEVIANEATDGPPLPGSYRHPAAPTRPLFRARPPAARFATAAS